MFRRLVPLLLLACLAGCKSSVVLRDGQCPNCNPSSADYRSAISREVDILFIIDNSLSMQSVIATLRDQVVHLIDTLYALPTGLPNVHIGVTTPSFGTTPYVIPGCETQENEGRLLNGEFMSCQNPRNQRYIIDVAAANCTVERDEETGGCAAHDCTDLSCRPESFLAAGRDTEPSGLILALDDKGCPRCRNYEGETLHEVFTCISSTGTAGCGFEQPLKAMEKVVTESDNYEDSRSFIRPGAYLALYFISDEDDCSVANTELFNPAEDPALGPLTSFRCTRFGVACDSPITEEGPHTGCTPLTDDATQNMLVSVEHYLDMLREEKGYERVVGMGAIGTPATRLVVGTDTMGFLRLEPICSGESVEAVPAARLYHFLLGIAGSPERVATTATSICEENFETPLLTMASRIINFTDPVCPDFPLSGCPDPIAATSGGEFRLTALPLDEALTCSPGCTVEEITDTGDTVPMEQCPGDYLGGQPPTVDPALPVERCWYITYSPSCDNGTDHLPSRGARFRFSSRTEIPAGLSYHVDCLGFPVKEFACHDGIDNNVNGLTDMEDPDCAAP